MTSKLTKGPLFAEVHNVPDDYHFTEDELDRIIAGDMFTPRQGAIMARELKERRKAEQDSEPVGTLSVRLMSYSGKKIGNQFGFAHSDAAMTIAEGDYQLYRHAQPAPVVPEEIPKLKDGRGFKYVKDGVCYSVNYANGWNQCRAAMLVAAPQSPGSEPATVPGKWIPVSERMPEVGVKVLCFPVKDEPIHATFNGQLWLQDVSWSRSEEPIDNVIPVIVTHWMPLPAAPQEVK